MRKLDMWLVIGILSSSCAGPAKLEPMPSTTIAPISPITSTVTPSPSPTSTRSPTLTPFPTPSPFPAPTPLPTLTPFFDIALPQEVGLDDFRIAMRRGCEGDVVLMETMPRYRISLEVDTNEGVIRGRERIFFTNNEDTALDRLVLRLFANFRPITGGIILEDRMRVGNVTVDGQPVEIEYSAANTAVAVHLPEALSPGEATELELNFSVALPPEYDGRRSIASGHPLLAVYEEKEWRMDIALNGDPVYSESALYTIDFNAPSSMRVAASGSAVSTIAHPDGTVTHRFLAPGMRDFAIAFGKSLQEKRADVSGTTVRLWHSPDDSLADAKLRVVVDALKTFDRLFGRYPYAEVDIVTLHRLDIRGGAGMEYPGLVFFAHGEKDWEYSLVHEVAHQWWYGVVGNDVHLEPWLDEALAEYSAFIYFQEVYGPNQAKAAFNKNVLRDYREGVRHGAITGEEPVDLSVYDFPPRHAMYSWIVYGKGALFLDELRNEMGDANFFRFLQEYYRQYKYQVATSEAFLELADQISDVELDAVVKGWVRIRE